MKRLLFITLIAAVMLLSLFGCTKKQEPEKTNLPAATKNEIVTDSTQKDKTPAAGPASWKAVLYFADKEGMKLYKEFRDIQTSNGTGAISTPEKARLLVEELLKGPKNKDLVQSIRGAVKVRSVTQDKDTIMVDLSREFVQDNPGGSAGETMALAPIVLTLTELEGVKQVGFKIEGKVQADFKGHYDLSRPFKRSDFEQFAVK